MNNNETIPESVEETYPAENAETTGKKIFEIFIFTLAVEKLKRLLI